MPNETTGVDIPPGFRLRHTLQGHKHRIYRIAWSPDGQTIASPSSDKTIGIWDAKTGELCTILEGHTDIVYSVTWSPDGRFLASGSADKTVRLWDMRSRISHRTLGEHQGLVLTVAWSPDGRMIVSGSDDNTLRLWDTATGKLRGILDKHTGPVLSAAWSPNGQLLASGAEDGLIHLWSISTTLDVGTTAWTPCQTLNGHTADVENVAWSSDGRFLASGGDDNTVRLWSPESGRQLNILQGHTHFVTSISFSSDNRLLASKSLDGTVRTWCCDTWASVAVLEESTANYSLVGLAFHPSGPILATLGEKDSVIRIWDLDIDTLLRRTAPSSVQYVNAKVVLVGESGVGKSGLGIRIAEGIFRLTPSTHGAQFWQIPVGQHGDLPDNIQAELTLWDLAGQPEYRLVHQLFLDGTDAALLLFDCSDPAEPFRGATYWAKVLKKQAPGDALKLLVSARCDVSPVTVGQHEINRMVAEYDLTGYTRTSAKTGEGVDTLWQQLLDRIAWDKLIRITTPRLFQVIRRMLLEHKEAGDVLLPMNKIRREVDRRYSEGEATQTEIDVVVGLLQAQGLVYRLEPTPRLVLVLLRPELINQYASSIIQAARNDPRGVGTVIEHDVVCAGFPIGDVERVEAEDEKMLLESTVELLIRHDLCSREMGMLIFPSQINATRPPADERHPAAEVAYQFSGSLEAIYASLVVRLSYTNLFYLEGQWRYAAEFSRDGCRLGFAMKQVQEGTGELEIYFHPGISESDRVTYIHFITDHLRTKGIDIHEFIHLYCHECREEVTDRKAIDRRVASGEMDIPCQYCGTPVIIPHSIEEKYRSDRQYVEKQHELTDTVKKRTQQEIREFQSDQRQYTKDTDQLIRILHLSDIHLGTNSQARKYWTQLRADLQNELEVNHLDYLVVSGDIANQSTRDEYEAAYGLLNTLVKRFGLNSNRIVIVPGNHDLNWDKASKAYDYVPQYKAPATLTGEYIPAGEAGILHQDQARYRERFAPFSAFYKKLYGGTPYPLDHAEQGILYACPNDHILFLALNSSWNIDQYYKERAGINMDALSSALERLADGDYRDWLKVAVWHHPVTGPGMIKDEFLEQLVVDGFQICMHGHIHEAKPDYFRYDRRGLYIIGAGTFGAPMLAQTAGIPLQYNLLTLDPETRLLTVKTRKKERPDGAWSADARWGDKNNPRSWYTVQLR